MTTTCTNPNCRHQSKRKLRPLVISLLPPDGSSSNGGGNSRHEEITRMFTTHPSLAAHFEPPTFSPGIPSREIRNRLNLLDCANRAGLIPEVEWEGICRAVSEQQQTVDDGGCVNGNSSTSACNEEENPGVVEQNIACEGGKHNVIDPFKYLAVETKIEPNEQDTNNNTSGTNHSAKTGRKKKKKSWLEYKTTSLVPISPHRRGSAEDKSLPYSMELWRKAKTPNRDRSVLACTLAHLMAMARLVGERSECESSSLGGGVDSDDGGFDFILEDNVRAFVGMEDNACECSNRIWDMVEASNQAPYECHMRYYGFLGSLPNLTWIYESHAPRSAFNIDNQGECTIFPFPTRDDFAESNKEDGKVEAPSEESIAFEEETSSADKTSSTPHFTTPGGTFVWGTFAYTISSAAYRTFLNQLQNDVGSLVWKGKRMRCYHAKPIDKILPRHITAQFGPESVHVSDRVSFVRGPMLGSLLHPQWESGFCNSTEKQFHLSCTSRAESSSLPVDCGSRTDGSGVWDCVWLTDVERQIVDHRKKSGKWITKSDIAEVMSGGSKSLLCRQHGHSWLDWSAAAVPKANQLAVIIVIPWFLSLFVDRLFAPPVAAFVFDSNINKRYKRRSFALMDGQTQGDRERSKLGKVPIISRVIPIDVNGPFDAESMNITVWEMDKPSDLIQEWWSVDELERSTRMGDPFGVVMWPGSILASQELMKQHHSSTQTSSPIKNKTVTVLGAGTGVEAQAAALLGAKKVIATDINPLTLKLLEYGAKADDRIGDTVEGRYFDLFSDEALPACDILIAADVLYNPELAKQVGNRLHEAIVRSFEEGRPPAKVIITDSQQFHGTNFLEEVSELKELNALFKENGWEQLKWETQKLENVSGSGVLVDEDQVYDVEVRIICWGWQW